MAAKLREFVRRIAESGVLTAAEVEAFINGLPEEKKPRDASQLARFLVHARKLTAFQAQMIWQGKGPQLVLGNYLLLSELGKGGMGVVYKAEHRPMQRIVALKVLTPSASTFPGMTRRFQREVRAMAQMCHPNIVTAYDAGEAHGQQYLVMQHVDGTNLSALVKERGPLPVAMALSCVIQAAHGLEYAHNRGLVHRDIKPGNLLLDRDGMLKILDLGLVRFDSILPEMPVEDITDSNVIIGSVDYMAPEQAANLKKSDRRSDIYSLGCSLWFLLTGREMYEGDSRMGRLVAHWEKPIPSLREARPEILPDLDEIFRKMVAKNPDNRYQTAMELIADLERYRTSEAAASDFVPAVEEAEVQDDILSQLLNECESTAFSRQTPATHPFARTSVGAPRTSPGKRFAVLGVSTIVATVLLVGLIIATYYFLPPATGKKLAGGPGPKQAKSSPVVPLRAGPTNLLIDDKLSEWDPNKAWKVTKEGEDLVLTGAGAGDKWLRSRADYSDFALNLEYRISDGADSGVFIRVPKRGFKNSFLRVQISHDDHPNNRSRRADEHTGALYQRAAPRPPKVSSVPGKWQKMAVEVKGRHIQAWIDGTLTIDETVNDQDPDMPASGGLGLDISEKPVSFRNIYVRNIGH